MNQKVVRLRGIYFKGTYINQYYHTATDRLVDESTSDELTLSMPLNLRDDFENGNVITVYGILDRTLTNKGLIQIVLKVTEVGKLKDLAVSEDEIKRTELRRIKSEKGFKNVDNILKTSCSQDYIHKKKQGGVTYKDLFGNYLRTVKEICITAPFIRQPYQIRLKSQKSERISPFWVGGYPPFSAFHSKQLITMSYSVSDNSKCHLI